MSYPVPKAPLAEAIAAIVGKIPPFEMDGIWAIEDDPDLLTDGLEGWCSTQVCVTEFSPWATGCGVLEAAELLLKTAIENGNLIKPEAEVC